MKKLKKFLLLSCAALLSLGCVFATGCKDEEEIDETGTETVEPSNTTSLTLVAESLDMIVGDKTRLTAWYTIEDGVALTYETDNADVVSVDSDGNLEAKLPGQATITVAYGEQRKTCAVSVSFGGMLPFLEWKQISDTSESVSVAIGGKLNMETQIWFNQNKYADFSVEYSVVGDVGEITDGIFTANDLGSCEITATAVWRELDGKNVATLQTSVTVDVVNVVSIIPNAKDYVLYTVDTFLGERYATELAFFANVNDNGTTKAVHSVELIEGDNVVEYVEESANSGVLRAKTYGTAKLQIEYTDAVNGLHTKIVDVVVERPVKTYENKLEFSTADSTFSTKNGAVALSDLFGEEVILTQALQDETRELAVSNNKLSGLAMNRDAITETSLLLYTDLVGVRVNVDGYGKIIRTEADLKVFDITDDDGNYATEADKRLDGYFILANNIKNDASVLANRHDGLQRQSGTERTDKISNLYYNGDAGFYGVFDGQGYTMAFDVYQGGLFGRLQPGALIKNVGMDVTFESDTVASAGIIAYSALKSTSAANAVTIQDVYVNVDDFRTANNSSGTALLVYPKPHVYLTRVVMNIGDVVCDENTRASGALYVADTSRGTDSGKKSQVFVISETPVFMSMDDNWTNDLRDQRQVAVTDVVEMTKNAVDSDATNNGKLALAIGTNVQGTALSERSIDTTGGVYCLLNTFRFNSVADMASAFENGTVYNQDDNKGNGYTVGNLSNFKAQNGWDTTSGAPVWANFEA